MYRVKTYLASSTIDGVGVFAGEDIAKGTLTWELVEGFDQIFDEAHLQSLPVLAQTYIRKYAFWNKGKIYLCGDHGQFTNHSDTPNRQNWPHSDDMSEIATRDIQKGEEITSDYRTFDDIRRKELAFLQIQSRQPSHR